MYFSAAATSDGLVEEVNRICGVDNNNYSLLAKTARINQALDRFASIALVADGNWTFDDLNKGDLPIGTADIVSGQQDYEFADEILVVQKVLAKNAAAGDWVELVPVGMMDDDAKNIWTLPSSNSGAPIRYQKFAHSFLLDPIPNYASTAGLKVVFKRNVVKFVSTDTSTECGIPSIFHPYICRMASLPYLIEKNLPQRGDIAAMIREDEQLIKEYFANRGKDKKSIIKMKVPMGR